MFWAGFISGYWCAFLMMAIIIFIGIRRFDKNKNK